MQRADGHDDDDDGLTCCCCCCLPACGACCCRVCVVPASRTVLVEKIPEDLRSRAKITAYFQTMYPPDAVAKASRR